MIKWINWLAKINLIWLFAFTMPFMVVLMFIFRFTPQIQFQLVTLAALFYLTVALLHHYKEKTLTKELMIEYVLMAALALIILQGLLI